MARLGLASKTPITRATATLKNANNPKSYIPIGPLSLCPACDFVAGVYGRVKRGFVLFPSAALGSPTLWFYMLGGWTPPTTERWIGSCGLCPRGLQFLAVRIQTSREFVGRIRFGDIFRGSPL